jgi:glycosyltransferase involved in cell wall biosynthesis
MKIAVYTIAKNEAKHVARWAESCKEADYRLILDTGSTDNTCQIAWDCDVTVETETFDPWRFDHARNVALTCLPDDIDLCISLDMDEVLTPGWRKALENLSPDINMVRHKDNHSPSDASTPDTATHGNTQSTKFSHQWH